MKILISIINEHTSGEIIKLSSNSVDGAIAELGRLERIMDDRRCLECGEPIPDEQAFCDEICAERWQETEDPIIDVNDLPF